MPFSSFSELLDRSTLIQSRLDEAFCDTERVLNIQLLTPDEIQALNDHTSRDKKYSGEDLKASVQKHIDTHLKQVAHILENSEKLQTPQGLVNVAQVLRIINTSSVDKLTATRARFDAQVCVILGESARISALIKKMLHGLTMIQGLDRWVTSVEFNSYFSHQELAILKQVLPKIKSDQPAWFVQGEHSLIHPAAITLLVHLFSTDEHKTHFPNVLNPAASIDTAPTKITIKGPHTTDDQKSKQDHETPIAEKLPSSKYSIATVLADFHIPEKALPHLIAEFDPSHTAEGITTGYISPRFYDWLTRERKKMKITRDLYISKPELFHSFQETLSSQQLNQLIISLSKKKPQFISELRKDDNWAWQEYFLKSIVTLIPKYTKRNDEAIFGVEKIVSA